MSNQVTFRRIGGRVVPIRQKQTAVAAVGTGLAVGAVSGAVAGKLDLHAAYTKAAARNEFKQKALKFRTREFRTAALHRLESIRAHKSAARIKIGGAAIGAMIVGAGVHSALKNTNLSEAEKTSVSGASGLGSYFAVRTMHTKMFGSTGLWYAMKHAAKRVAIRGTKL